MATKSKQTALGSFDRAEAELIARLLGRRESIEATIENVRTDSGPTTWWRVLVPSKMALVASAWLSGWRVGRMCGSIEMSAALHGNADAFDDTARRMGYMELTREGR